MSWIENLELAKKDSKTFLDKGEKIVKRFRDEGRGQQSTLASNEVRRFNILWSNIKTLFPAVYSRKPRAEVERRYKDKDPVGRTAAQILERSLQYEIDHYPDYDAAIRGCLLDRLLPGRGVAWIRFEAGDQITDDVTPGEEEAPEGVEGVEVEDSGMSLLGLMGEQPTKTDPKDYECTPCDYVYWKDFRHSPARTWEEVTWVARRVYMDRNTCIKRFGDDVGGQVPLSHEPIGLDKDIAVTDDMKKAVIWEIWNKPTMKVIWLAEGFAANLDERDDPLGLEGFFPCPKPLFATMTTDTLQPIADYLEYQDQASELDEITQRISILVRAVKAVGVYDASQIGVQRLMEEGYDNTLIPVENWAAFSSAGGLANVVQMLPLDTVVKALQQLYISRDSCKQVIYEVTGMSDILRGATDPNETYGAQKIKSQFGSLRVKEIQQDVDRFATDLLNKKAQVMGSMYRPETLKEMSGIMQTEDAQYADQAIQLIQNESMRSYRIAIAADSMVELDEQAEKESRLQFLAAAGQFLKEAVAAAQQVPQIAPLLGEMLMFGVRSYKAARPIEAAFEQAVQKLSEPQPEKPDPETAKAQGEAQKAQVKAQADIQIAQIDMQAKSAIAQAQAQAQQQTDMVRQQMEERQHAAELDMKARIDQMQAAFDAQQSMRDMQFERWKVEKEAETKLGVAQITAQTTLTAQQEGAADDAARD